MKNIYKSSFLLILFLVARVSLTQAQVTVLKSTTSLCRDISMPVYYTAYGCDGQVQWLNWLQQPIGTSNVSSDVPGFQGSNTYYVKCGTSSPQVFYIDKTKTVRSTRPTVSASSTTINNGESVTLTASGCTGTVSWMSGNYVLSNSSSYTLNPTTSTSYFALCTESGKCVSEASSQIITITVNNQSLSAPVINTQNAAALSSGVSTNLGAFNCFYTVQWYKNGNSIGSGNSISVIPVACDSYTATCVNGSIVSSASNALVASAVNPTITTQPQGSSVCSGSNQTLSVVATGATGYQWRRNGSDISGATNSSLTVSNITSTNAGAYDVVISSACGSVTSQAVSFTIAASNPPTITTQPQGTSVCLGTTQTLSVVATGATGYQWRRNGTDISGATNSSLSVSGISTLNLGAYDVVVSSTCGSVTSQSTSFTILSGALTLVTSPQGANVCAGSNHTLSVVATGATSYQWSLNSSPISGATNSSLTVNNITAANAGAYSVVVSNACGGNVLITEPVSLTLNSPAVITTQPQGGTVCAGSNHTLSVVATGATGYQWRRNGSNISGATNASLTVSNITSTNAGAYDVVISSSCGSVTSQAVSFTIAASNPPTITTQPQGTSVCLGTTQTLSVVATGATGYQWRRNGTDISGATNSSLSVSGISTLNLGAYDVVVSSTCGSVTSQSTSFTILSGALTLVTSPQGANVCAGSNHTLSVVATGATSYQWSLNSSPISGATNSSLTVNNITAANAGAYSVVVSNACGGNVLMTEPVSLTLNSPAVITTQPQGGTVCAGSNHTLSVVATGATGYQWRINGSNILGATNASLTVSNITSTNAGAYDVVISSSCGSVTTETAILTISTGPSLSLTTNNVSCFGLANGSATVTATGKSSYRYSWTNGGTTATINNLAPNTYTVTVTDGDGCTKSGSVSITEPTALALSTSNTAVSCKNGSNGSVTANPSGGTGAYSYVWSNGATTQTVTNLTAGTYNVTITDANGCTKTGSATVSEPTEILLTSSSVPVKCKGERNGSASVVASGGTAPYAYSWAGFELPSNATLSNVPAGTYTVTVTDGNGCTKATTIEVVEAATLLTITGTPTTAVKCNGGNDGTASVNVTGGSGTYSYTWRTGASTQTISNLSAGEYGISVLDAYGCVKNASVIITEPTLLTLSMSNVAVKCKNGNDGSATVTPAGGTSPYSYSWSNGAITQTATNLVAGTYNVTVTDANNCSKTTSVVMTEPTLVVLSTSSIAVKCKNGNDGSATVNVTGGTGGYSYLWSTGAITPTINNLVAGTYSVIVTDANNCSKNSSVIVTEPTELMISGSSVSVKCKNGNDGSATVTATGGTAPYTYLWDRGARSAALSNVSAGTYNVTVTDANNCFKNINVVVTEPTALSISTSNVAVKCKNGNDGSATVTATGGTSPYRYTWSNGATTATANNLTAGTYNITVTDANGCSQTASVSISEPTELLVTGSSVSVKCKNGNDGSATINVSGGTSPYTYVWNTGATTTSIANLVAGTYSVTVTDANNCVKNINIVVTEPTELLISTSSIAVKCKNGKDGSVTVNATGGTGAYTYRWSNGSTSQTATNLTAGTYSVTVTDANNCSKNSTVVVTEPTALTYQFTKEDVKCNAGSDGKITVIAQGGTSPYKFIYNGTAAADLMVATLKAGEYAINVQDNNNCLATEQKAILTQPAALEVSLTEELMPRGFQTKDGRLVTKIVGGTTKQTSLYTTAWLFEGTTTVLDKQVLIAGGTNSTIDKIQGGNYTLTVTDDNFALSKTNEGCKKVFTYFVKQPDKIVSVAAVDKSVSCFGKLDGKLTATVKGGVTFKTGATYLYKWFKQDQAGWINLNLSTATIQYVDAGQYMVKIEDANGITDSTQVSLKVTPSISSKVISQVNPSCSASKDGVIEVQAIGAVEPITVTWSKALTGTKITNLAQGNYFGIIKDNAGCFGEVTVTLTAKENVSAELISKKELVCADKCDAVLELAVKGANSPYTVQWSNGVIGLKNSQLCAGTYSATIKTTNGCAVSVDNMKLDAPQAFKIEVSNDIDICSESTLEINAASKVAQGLSYVWTYPNGTKSTNPIASIKTAGTYKIEVVNTNGCSASDEFKVNVQNVITGINFTVASQGQVGESIYAVNLSPTSLATTWNVIGSADILQNDKAILMIKPTTEGTLKVELTATVGTCKANLVKSISIGKASTVTPKSTPKVELESIDDLFLVYPNPNEGHFAIKADPSMEGEVQIKIYNASLSEVLYTETFDTTTKSQIDVTIPEVLNNLLYVVIQSQNKKTVKRVLVRP